MGIKLFYENAGPAIRIALIYFVLSFLWIYFSDQLITYITIDPELLTRIQTYKGWFFITSSSGLIYYLIYREIKNKNKIIKRINESELWYNKLVSNIPDVGVILLDSNAEIILAQGQDLPGEIISFNHISGRKAEDVFKKTALSNDVLPQVDRILIGETIHHEFKYDRHWFLLTGAPVFDEDYKIDGGVLSFLDVSTIKEKEEQIIEAKERAEEGDRIKTAFISNLSHEIRTPMNGILGFTELITEDDLTTSQRMKYGEIIRNSTHQLKSIIESIIQISKIQTGQVKVSNTLLNLNDFMFHLYDTVKDNEQLQINNNQILLNNQLQQKDRLFNTDPVLLLEIFTHLLSNAMKYTNNGMVIIGCKESEINPEEIIFSVTDNGIGIEKEKQGQIFHSFRQAEDPHTRTYSGIGLGLSIASGLVKLLKGKINLESEKGKGSIFSFSVKSIEQDQMDRANEIPPQNQTYDFHGKKIMIVEDVRHNSELFRIILRTTKAELIFAKDGQEAIDVCNEVQDVDLVLMDLRMPNLNGFEATRIIKEQFPEIKVIAQTAYAGPKEIKESFDAGCTDYIEKPIHRQRLLQILDKHLTTK